MSAYVGRMRDVTGPLALGVLALGSAWLPGAAGQIALYPLLGAFPGLALAWALLPRASATTRWVTGLALAPLVSSIAGWALLALSVSAPSAARVVGAAGWLLWTVQMLRVPRAAGVDAALDLAPSRALWLLAAVLAAAIALPHIVNPWMLVKSDAWFHGALVYQILERGIPPQDARVAGLPLNYVWFFNLYVALLSSVRDGDPFVFMTTLNVVDVALLAWLAALAGWTLWRTRDGALGAALLTCLGFNALAWLSWPLRGVHNVPAFLRGTGALTWSVPALHLRSWLIMADLGAPFTFIQNFVDKFVTGTSINYTWLLMVLWLWAMVAFLRDGRRGLLAVAALASGGMQLWHGVVGLSVIPVGLCALLLLLLLKPWMRWLPATGRIAAVGLATLLGFLATLPYTLSISRGWDASRTGLHIAPVRFDVAITITVVTSCAFATVFAWRPMLEALRERRAPAATLLAYAIGIYAFSLLIALPNWNETKFAFEAFIPLALFGGERFIRWARAIRTRWGLAGGTVLAAALALPLILTLTGFTLDSEGLSYAPLHPAPGENALYAALRAHTPRDMVFVDNRFRDLIMVRARRQLYLGSSSGPERAAFPIAEVTERRAVMADLYGPASDLDADVAAMKRLGRPVAVVYRATDAPAGTRPGAAAAARADLFETIYDRDGFEVLSVRATRPVAEVARP